MKKESKNTQIAIIMAGGMGERFWPKTSERLPKYAIPFNGKTTFLEDTYTRLLPLFGKDRIYVATAKEQASLVARLLPRLKRNQILSEPYRRNTAGATTFSTLHLKKQFGHEAVLAFFPADALIQNIGVFRKLVKRSLSLAREEDRVVVMGVPPTRIATGYGYVECGSSLNGRSPGVFWARRFREKPSEEVARRFVRSGRFFWNAGIFFWKIQVFEDAMKKHAPGYFRKFHTLNQKRITSKGLAKLFRNLPILPIDKLLVEKLRKLLVIKAAMGWDDIGSWEALRRMQQDRQGNLLLGDVIAVDVRNSLIEVPPGERLVISGVRDLILVSYGDELLICSRAEAEKVKDLRKLWQQRFKRASKKRTRRP